MKKLIYLLFFLSTLHAVNPPRNLDAVAANGQVALTWETPMPEGWMEIHYHDSTPYGGYQQTSSSGFGVVFDLNQYPGATLEQLDFRHSSYGIAGPFIYKIHLVNWTTGQVISISPTLTTLASDSWETQVDLNSISVSGMIGVFIQPLGNTAEDAFPVLDYDRALNGASYIISLNDYSLQQIAEGDFLMNLYIGNTTGRQIKAPLAGRRSTLIASSLRNASLPQTEFFPKRDRATYYGQRSICSPARNYTYRIYRDGSLIFQNQNTTSFTDTAVENGVTYSYYVTAILGTEESSPSNYVTATPLGMDYLLREDFESDFFPAGWTAYDVDNDGKNWELKAYEPGINAHSGTRFIWSASYDNVLQLPLTPNNYLVTKRLYIPNATANLKFWVAAQDEEFHSEKYKVFVSTAGNAPLDFTTEIFHDTLQDADWHEKNVSLSTFAGQEIYLAFVHTGVTDQYYLKLDDISVYYTPSGTHIADFSATPLSGFAPLGVHFTDASQPPINSWHWDFGDNVTSSEQSPMHNYTQPGIYSIRLKVTRGDSTDSITRLSYITVNSPAITADFMASPLSGSSPMSVQFTDLSQGIISNWEWNFGDGSTSQERSPLHIYQSEGSFNVTLTVSNAMGQNSITKNNYIAVNPSLLTADFSATPTSGYAPMTVQFTDLSVGNPTLWSWSFGDNTFSTEQNPEHVFQTPGLYTVTLNIFKSNQSGTKVRTNYIHVQESGSQPSVWPGDTDRNGNVNEEDIAPIAAYWRKTGAPRNPMSYHWQGWSLSANWSPDAAAYADCNGDGSVNSADILAICINWQKTNASLRCQNESYEKTPQYYQNLQEIYAGLGNSQPEKSIKRYIEQELGYNTPQLGQNCPNPFNPNTEIEFYVPQASSVELTVFDIKGAKVTTLFKATNFQGQNKVRWEGVNDRHKKVASGIYFYRLKIDNKILTKKMLMLK